MRPIGVPFGDAVELSAWNAVEASQRAVAPEYWLIEQPDHAAIAGQIAAALNVWWMPALTPEAIRAIALHDEGWREFESPVRLTHDGLPQSFIEVPAPDFLGAWTGSIERASQEGALAGIMVSRHFCRILRSHPQDEIESTPDMQKFLEREMARQQRLAGEQPKGFERVMESLVDVLQFCDLISLCLCCETRVTVEFPQDFNRHRITLSSQSERESVYRVEPSPFSRELILAIPAQRWPEGERALLPIMLD